MKRSLKTGVAAVLLATSLPLATGAPAEASPSGCSSWRDGNGQTANCGSGDGVFRAYAACRNKVWPNYWWTATGPWHKPGEGPSHADCGWWATYQYGYYGF